MQVNALWEPRLLNNSEHAARAGTNGERMKKLTGKTVIITGASGGIGAETARLFYAEGANLMLVDREAFAVI